MPEELKNWFDKAFYVDLASALADAHPPFDQQAFVGSATDGLDALELKQRLLRTAELCRRYLPSDYGEALDILYEVAPRYEGQFRGMFAPEFVGLYGLDDRKRSLEALKFLTRFSTSESAIRPFIEQDLAGTLKLMARWTKDKNHHVRRLASEGCRPRLPWSSRLDALIDDPTPVYPILDALNADPELYVRKSVANHLNDISKDNPEIMLDWVESWDRQDERTAWIVRHGARSLIKAGHPRSFALFGFEAKPRLAVEDLKAKPKRIKLGQTVTFSFDIASRARRDQKLAVDYAIHYVKASGRPSRKVFKLCEVVLQAGERQTIEKRQTFKDFSTRTHHPGRHVFELLINGKTCGEVGFDLKR